MHWRLAYQVSLPLTDATSVFALGCSPHSRAFFEVRDLVAHHLSVLPVCDQAFGLTTRSTSISVVTQGGAKMNNPVHVVIFLLAFFTACGMLSLLV